MAGDDGKASATEKGKAKATDAKETSKDATESKDGESKKDGEKLGLPEEELSEEDQKLKDDLDMLVERLQVLSIIHSFYQSKHSKLPQGTDSSLYKPALEQIKTFIKTSTSSMTAVPKPLKFLRPHYEALEKLYESWPQGDDKVCRPFGRRLYSV